jgi:hypothetical protein
MKGRYMADMEKAISRFGGVLEIAELKDYAVFPRKADCLAFLAKYGASLAGVAWETSGAKVIEEQDNGSFRVGGV